MSSMCKCVALNFLSRIKIIILWHSRWLVRTSTNISLWPSGLVRPRTDQVAAKCIIKNKNKSAAIWIGYKRANVHANCHLVCMASNSDLMIIRLCREVLKAERTNRD